MLKSNLKYAVLSGFLTLFIIQKNYAGPPFLKDDPEPVEYQHWEYYIASINTYQSELWTGTCPHLEVNYGIIHNVQLHMILPLNYEYALNHRTNFGYGYSEFGIKYRFINETKIFPQIGTFPILEIPTINNNNFSNGKPQIYLPIWVQKSWEKLTTYGGTGYWINPGKDNRNWIFTGWEIQYDFTKKLLLAENYIIIHQNRQKINLQLHLI